MVEETETQLLNNDGGAILRLRNSTKVCQIFPFPQWVLAYLVQA